MSLKLLLSDKVNDCACACKTLVTGGTAVFKGQDLFAMEPEERARLGLFLSFQSPIEVSRL